MNAPVAPRRPASSKERLNTLLAEYGPVALGVYFAIFVVVLVAFAWAIEFGFRDTVDSWVVQLRTWLPWAGDAASAGSVGTWMAAYAATKVVQPVRIAMTLILTPLAASLFRRERKLPQGSSSAPSSNDAAS